MRNLNAVEVQGELEQDYVKVLEDLVDKWMEGKEDSCFQDCLTEGHVTNGRKVWSLIQTRSVSHVPQSVFTSYRR